MKTCPKCGEILYRVNSCSDKYECLSKTCDYSEIDRVGINLIEGHVERGE
jgi:hypothetical protein